MKIPSYKADSLYEYIRDHRDSFSDVMFVIGALATTPATPKAIKKQCDAAGDLIASIEHAAGLDPLERIAAGSARFDAFYGVDR